LASVDKEREFAADAAFFADPMCLAGVREREGTRWQREPALLEQPRSLSESRVGPPPGAAARIGRLPRTWAWESVGVAVRAVVLDVGGVLERVAPPEVFAATWRRRLGLSGSGFQAALRQVDPDNVIETGRLTEAEFQQRYAEALGLSHAQSEQFLADLWDWYCGQLDAQLAAYVGGFRPRYRTAILSNSADGARREEQARYSFDDLVDTIIYSHEVGLAKPDPRIFALACDRLRVRPSEAVFLDDAEENVEAAGEFGLQAVLHSSTPTSIASINALITA